MRQKRIKRETAERPLGGGPGNRRGPISLEYYFTPTSPALSTLLDQAIQRTEHAQAQADAWREIAWRHRRVKSELAEVRSCGH